MITVYTSYNAREILLSNLTIRNSCVGKFLKIIPSEKFDDNQIMISCNWGTFKFLLEPDIIEMLQSKHEILATLLTIMNMGLPYGIPFNASK